MYLLQHSFHTHHTRSYFQLKQIEDFLKIQFELAFLFLANKDRLKEKYMILFIYGLKIQKVDGQLK